VLTHNRRVGRGRNHWTWAVAALTALAAVRRFATISHQSFWRDEGLTVWESSKSLGGMLSTIPNTEGHPPVYPIAAWAWVHVFGTSELAVRSLSALAGAATVPVLYAAVATLASRRAGLLAAALVALSPFGLYYSQEARPYALMLLFAAISFLAFAKLLKAPERRWLVIWALASALALATHYFSGFLLVAVAATGLALLPLLVHQRNAADTQWVGLAAGRLRVKGITEELLLGPQLHRTLAFVVAFLVVAAGLVALARAPRDERSPGLVVLGVLAAGFAIPVALKIAGSDYLMSRYVAVLLIPLLALVAIALTVRGIGPLGMAGAAVLCAAMLVMGFVADSDRPTMREDWRGAAKALGASTEARVIVAAPTLTYAKSATIPPLLSHYLDGTRPLPDSGALVREIEVVRVASAALGDARVPVIPAAFREVARRATDTFTIVRLRAPRPVWYSPEVHGDPLTSQSSVLLQAAGRD
jgi:mannosyltransferase